MPVAAVLAEVHPRLIASDEACAGHGALAEELDPTVIAAEDETEAETSKDVGDT
jgi:hypothetical protein